MSIVQVTAPSSSGQVAYGAITLNFAPGGTDGIPLYVAKYLVAHGFTCTTNTSAVNVRNELSTAPAAESRYYLMAMGIMNPQGMDADLQTQALAIYDQRGAPT